MMRLQAARATHKDGRLIFADPGVVPRDGTEVVVTFVGESEKDVSPGEDPIRALRGRGKGEDLVEKLLASRREDKERDERRRAQLCA